MTTSTCAMSPHPGVLPSARRLLCQVVDCPSLCGGSHPVLGAQEASTTRSGLQLRCCFDSPDMCTAVRSQLRLLGGGREREEMITPGGWGGGRGPLPAQEILGAATAARRVSRRGACCPNPSILPLPWAFLASPCPSPCPFASFLFHWPWLPDDCVDSVPFACRLSSWASLAASVPLLTAWPSAGAAVHPPRTPGKRQRGRGRRSLPGGRPFDAWPPKHGARLGMHPRRAPRAVRR